MKRSVLFFFLFAAAATAVACGGSSEGGDVSDSSEDELTAGRGQLCGGFAGTTCSPGLRCNYGSRGLNTGTCVDDPNAVRNGATEGETCGGPTNIKCKTGLTCKKRAGASATAKGKCTAPVAQCEAIPTCDEGHQKVSGPSACLQDDAACYKRSMCGQSIWCTGPAEGGGGGDGPGAGPGEMCGGFAGTQCRAGLRCDNSRGLNTGYCR
jgi:hypothetical protein